MTASSARATQQGNDPFRELRSVTGATFAVTYWDLWLIIVLVYDFATDWDRLIDHWRGELKTGWQRRDEVEGWLSHLLHLRQALTDVGCYSTRHHKVAEAQSPAQSLERFNRRPGQKRLDDSHAPA